MGSRPSTEGPSHRSFPGRLQIDRRRGPGSAPAGGRRHRERVRRAALADLGPRLTTRARTIELPVTRAPRGPREAGLMARPVWIAVLVLLAAAAACGDNLDAPGPR
ncbi:MAG TPA: hypothetical protein VN253_07925, partial [Kofleriaceae bacterium]|nr:hypothetical protein [Kofleriaceae bacterium]